MGLFNRKRSPLSGVMPPSLAEVTARIKREGMTQEEEDFETESVEWARGLAVEVGYATHLLDENRADEAGRPLVAMALTQHAMIDPAGHGIPLLVGVAVQLAAQLTNCWRVMEEHGIDPDDLKKRGE